MVAVYDPAAHKGGTGGGWVGLLEWSKDFDRGERDHNVAIMPLSTFKSYLSKGLLKHFTPQYGAHALPNK